MRLHPVTLKLPNVRQENVTVVAPQPTLFDGLHNEFRKIKNQV
jgi:hypothetical protein